MPKYLRSSDKIKLNTFNDLFGEAVEAKNIGNRLMEVPLSELHEFKGHPFVVRDDEEMNRLVESIREYGVLHPGIARPLKRGSGYELIAGHRRKHASEIAGKEKMPVFLRNYDDDEATIIMVDSNLQREQILPSEKARAYRMKYEAIIHQGKRGLWSLESLGEQTGESGKTVQRFIRLSYLSDDILQMIDDKELGIRQGVDLSYLTCHEQEIFFKVAKGREVDLSMKNTGMLKKERGALTEERIRSIVEPEKKEQKARAVSISVERIKGYFPEGTSEDDMIKTVYDLLDQWSKG